ncbi:gp53-like domain-containing protein [Ensifer aridi]|uniref:gp53-like domain-containing protein n=1 Tax=Ensifer aridi TaxID=1708715 RepID=UPI001FCCC9B1|nr:hypothetical protein [Ensifer aridi]
MPRTGGVYSPPAGTKGVSNTTIQSVPYNAFVDDLTADANSARPVTAGGTGATNATSARTNLGVAIGSDVQAYDPGLASIAGLTTSANQMIYTTAADVYATTALTPFARTILDDVDAAAVRSTIGLGSLSTANSVNDSNWSGTDLAVANGGTGASDAVTARSNLGAQAALGFTPVQQGTGTQQSTSAVKIGWSSTGDSTLRLTVDASNFDYRWPIGIRGSATKLRANGNIDATEMIFHWSGQGGQPSWLWGGNDGTNMYVYNPSNFSVNYAASAGNADTVDGLHASAFWKSADAGGAPSSGWVKFPNGLILQIGSSVVTTNSNAGGTIFFPTSFPTAVNSVVGVIGDTNVPASTIKIVTPIAGNGFSFISPGAASQAVRVNWFAWGS